MDNLEAIRDILRQHVGKSNKVTSSQIAKKININEDRFQIHRRIRLAFIILVIDKFILPSDNLLCRNISHF